MLTRLFSQLFKKVTPENPSLKVLMDAQLIEEHLSLAATYQVARRPRQALDQCNYVLQLDPRNEMAYHLRALARYSIGDRIGAQQDWDQSYSLKQL